MVSELGGTSALSLEGTMPVNDLDHFSRPTPSDHAEGSAEDLYRTSGKYLYHRA